jgi:hypothetical protein
MSKLRASTFCAARPCLGSKQGACDFRRRQAWLARNKRFDVFTSSRHDRLLFSVKHTESGGIARMLVNPPYIQT